MFQATWQERRERLLRRTYERAIAHDVRASRAQVVCLAGMACAFFCCLAEPAVVPLWPASLFCLAAVAASVWMAVTGHRRLRAYVEWAEAARRLRRVEDESCA